MVRGADEGDGDGGRGDEGGDEILFSMSHFLFMLCMAVGGPFLAAASQSRRTTQQGLRFSRDE